MISKGTSEKRGLYNPPVTGWSKAGATPVFLERKKSGQGGSVITANFSADMQERTGIIGGLGKEAGQRLEDRKGLTKNEGERIKSSIT